MKLKEAMKVFSVSDHRIYCITKYWVAVDEDGKIYILDEKTCY